MRIFVDFDTMMVDGRRRSHPAAFGAGVWNRNRDETV